MRTRYAGPRRQCVVDGCEVELRIQNERGYCRDHKARAPEHNDTVKAYRAERRVWLNQVKETQQCMDCREAGLDVHWPACALDFDHLPGHEKVVGLSMGALYMAWEDIQVEMAKCDVVCASHHRIRTAVRLQHADGDDTRAPEARSLEA